ncbi:MAG: hypothetical protein KGJ89_00870 [Patescibacteria group bacterium]|nr:hypothetical protein [Patescibacteria group bacterium]MDE2015066.1 hypothetical protein [Patescibacteria group bacterium]MDE2226494.1 hypothetical protein [Patescibacteria group bacterium]
MKFFVVALFLIALVIGFLVISFSGDIQAQIVQALIFFVRISTGDIAVQLPTAETPASTKQITHTSSTGFMPPGFIGPSGPPHIKGPTSPPPNY